MTRFVSLSAMRGVACGAVCLVLFGTARCVRVPDAVPGHSAASPAAASQPPPAASALTSATGTVPSSVAPLAPSADACPRGRRVVWRGPIEPGWPAPWQPNAPLAFGAENIAVVDDARFNHALRVRYPAGSSSPAYAREGHPMGGAEVKVALPGPPGADALFLSYAVRFDPAFPWVRGGKLPGVCGGSCPSGGARVTGEGGWSARLMWRPRGEGEIYAYILPPREYGTELGLGRWRFGAGEWHRIGIEVVLNAPGASNGVSRVWYDAAPNDSPTYDATGLAFRRDATGATTLFFSTFFGGHDGSWATPVDTFIDFADFVACR